jgi:hypothetical protein
MAPSFCSAATVAVVLATCAGLAASKGGNPGEWKATTNAEGQKVQQMEIKAPAMTEEDQYGYTMPDRYRCDACRAVVYHLGQALEQRQPKSRRLQEWEYVEVFDETCRQSSFKGYGITLIDGENALSGPGIKKEGKLQAGQGAIQMGGETWEKRLGEICRKLVYDRIGEEELYEHFHSHGGLLDDGICFKETRDCSVGPKAAPKMEIGDKPAGEKRVKKEKKEKRKPEPALDATTFFTKLAVQHGIPKADYTGKRGYAEWEKVILAAAMRISGRSAEKSEEVQTV